jgi:DNA helicase-2/ATP-dependent DNA helicase PcrA
VASGLRAFPIKGKSEKSVATLGNLMTALEKAEHSPARRLELTVEYYAPILQQRFDDWPKRQRDLEQLLALCQKYRSLESMLTDLTLEPPTHSRVERLAGPGEEDQLVLSTMHSAKGLEWKTVFIIQAIDGCIPMVYFDDDYDEEKLDEELRLLYVAVTRAEDTLYILHPRETARGYGYGWAEVSRFLDDVPESLLDAQRASDLLRAMPGGSSRRNKRNARRRARQ